MIAKQKSDLSFLTLFLQIIEKKMFEKMKGFGNVEKHIDSYNLENIHVPSKQNDWE